MRLGIQFLKDVSLPNLEKLSEDDLVKLVATSSNSIAKNIRNLRKNAVASVSQLLQIHGKEKIVTERKAKSLSKWSKTALIKEAISLSYIAKAKTSTVEGTKEMIEEVKASTGKDLRKFTSKDWEKYNDVVELMKDRKQEYSSNDILSAYDKDSSVEDIAVESRASGERQAVKKAIKDIEKEKQEINTLEIDPEIIRNLGF